MPLYTVRWKERGKAKTVMDFATRTEVLPLDILVFTEMSEHGMETTCLRVEVRVIRDPQTVLICCVTCDPEKQGDGDAEA